MIKYRHTYHRLTIVVFLDILTISEMALNRSQWRSRAKVTILTGRILFGCTFPDWNNYPTIIVIIISLAYTYCVHGCLSFLLCWLFSISSQLDFYCAAYIYLVSPRTDVYVYKQIVLTSTEYLWSWDLSHTKSIHHIKLSKEKCCY